MKRKDLKPGEWYLHIYDEPPYPEPVKALTTGEFVVVGGLVYFTDVAFFAGKQERIESIHIEKTEDELVTPCDPPAWFGEVWVKHEELTASKERTNALVEALDVIVTRIANGDAMDAHELEQHLESLASCMEKKGGSNE